MALIASGSAVESISYRSTVTRVFAADQLLRRYGFTIAYRRASAEPIWTMGGKLLPQSQALKMVPWNKVEDAFLLEALLAEGLE